VCFKELGDENTVAITLCPMPSIMCLQLAMVEAIAPHASQSAKIAVETDKKRRQFEAKEGEILTTAYV